MPEGFPFRATIIAMTFVVALLSLIVQGELLEKVEILSKRSENKPWIQPFAIDPLQFWPSYQGGTVSPGAGRPLKFGSIFDTKFQGNAYGVCTVPVTAMPFPDRASMSTLSPPQIAYR